MNALSITESVKSVLDIHASGNILVFNLSQNLPVS